MASIRISQLNEFGVIKAEDFVPLVDSSSLTTYRVTVTSFGDWLSVSGSCVSASWASSSLTSISSSWASSSISSITASHLLYPNTSTASFSMNGVSSSYSVTSSHANSAFVTTGTASYANEAKTSSYAGTASVAITASYFNLTLPNNIPPFATSSLSSSWASASYTASIATTASYAHTASYAVSASYVSRPGVSSVIQSSNIGLSWWTNYAVGAFAIGDGNLYIIQQNHHTIKTNIVRINMQTNEAIHYNTFDSYGVISYFNGKVFKRSQDGKLYYITYTNVGVFLYNITDNSTPVRINTAQHYYHGPVKIANWTSLYTPDMYAVNNGHYLTNHPTYQRRRVYHTGVYWTYSDVNINMNNVLNNTLFRNFINYSTNPDQAINPFGFDYNYVKNRYYMIIRGVGFLHIFNQTTGDIITNWDPTAITYEKTIAIPVAPMDRVAYYQNEITVIDYDVDTGEERGIIILRGGNTEANGTVSYLNWPESGNW